VASTIKNLMLQQKFLIVLTSLIVMLALACVPPGETNDQEISIDLSDPIIQSIYDLQDRRNYLLTILHQKYDRPRPMRWVRLEMKQQKMFWWLHLQSKTHRILIQAYEVPYLKQLVSVDQLLLGQVRSIYRFAQRGLTDKLGADLMLRRLTDKRVPNTTRRVAGQYVSRFSPDISDYKSRLTEMLGSEKDPEIRMSVATALSKSGDATILPNLLSTLKNDQDYRVQCNILRHLDKYDYYNYRDSILSLIETPNQHVANTAIQLLTATANRRDAGELLNRAKGIAAPRKKGLLLGAALNCVPSNYINTRKIINKEIIDNLSTINGSYDKIPYINALALDPLNYDVFKSVGLNSSEAPVQTAAIAAVPSLLSNIRTLRVYRRPGALNLFKKKVITDLLEVVGTGDVGALAGIASVMRDESLSLRPLVDTIRPFREALDQLELPGDIETANELRNTIAFLQDTTTSNLQMDYNHPIDWTQLDNLSDSSHAVIITTRGQIELKLYTSSAPGSIANFVKLANDNYYDGKSIHRVVPNFVMQGGCPRGDGYGGLGYTIRSDVSQHYYDEAGYIGMASAGADTEGTQWFITHSATPHLDGRYTIFGKVTSGLDVVQQIQVGDIIQDVRILKFR